MTNDITKTRKSPYHQMIAPIARGHDTGQIEAFMRLEHGTLDRLSPSQFKSEVNVAIECIMDDPALAESLAASYGI